MRFHEYLKSPGSKIIKLVIMGKDPYPNNSCYIPFCKPNWAAQLSERYCGVSVLRSIGVDVEKASSRFILPIDLFLSLRTQGIVFLNLSNQYVGRKITKKRDIQSIYNSYEDSKTVLKFAEHVILCGEALKLKWVHSLDYSRYHLAIHPDPRNRNNPKRKTEWSAWWSRNIISDKYNIHIT